MCNVVSDWLLLFVGSILGAGLTFFFQKIQKNWENKVISKNNAHYVNLLLVQQRASLQTIHNFIADRQLSKQHQQHHRDISARPLLLKIKQETIEKILIYKKFHKSNYANVIQILIAAEQSYRQCFELINDYNQAVQKLLELRVLPKPKESLEAVCLRDVCSYLENIDKEYSQAVKLNDKAKDNFEKLCNNVFGKCFKPLITADIVTVDKLNYSY